MIGLDDPCWTKLSHAYGSAAEIPKLLRQLARETGPQAEYDSEPWFTLWSSLCHQGDVFDASYAALPHIVAMGCSAIVPIDLGFFQLPAAIEIARRNGNGPPIPDYLAVAYNDAISQLSECVKIHFKEDWDQSMLLSAVSALAVAKGHTRLAEAVMNLDDDLITKLIELDFRDS